MRLSACDTGRPFALLGPGFGAGQVLLVEGLRELDLDSPEPRLVFAPYESQGHAARAFRGEILRSAALEIDVSAPSLEPELDASGHSAAVARIREAIAAGDVYQVNLTLRAKLPATSGAELAAALCRRGVPRFFAWVRLPDGTEFVSASPELFFAIEADRIHVEPMKGTAAPARRAELESSAKDRAELAMITDLMRNDLTPLCVPRSVRVRCARRILELPYALQAVSDVEGDLLPGIGIREVLGGLHPGGSITGAPKAAAMRMIAELEPEPRGPYCGVLAWSEAEKTVASLLIRTATRVPSGWSYGVGGGIVWQSEAARELEEIQVKLGALR